MARWISVVLALAFVVMLGFAAYRRDSVSVAAPAPPAESPSSNAGSGDGGSGGAEPMEPDAGSAGSSALPPDAMVPPLPADAPKSVEIGVIQFNYKGAQAAPRSARSKREAEDKARKALADAKQDFADAVKLGDPGSAADVGRMPRGVLEPHLEYAVFTLEKGQVFDEPLDTPRGYWIVKRLK